METSYGLRTASVCPFYGQSFWTALLLTSSPSKAEQAVIHGIQSLKGSVVWEGDLLQATVTAALLERDNRRQRPEDLADATKLLPFELGRVLRLPSNLRHCFILRTLAGLPVATCARLLSFGEGMII
ncbi:MAG: hypothetical protein M3Y27_06500 [Acidobacteriota bacterium]|nr:hypothetical protein [Acidobacteriota bacterium]